MEVVSQSLLVPSKFNLKVFKHSCELLADVRLLRDFLNNRDQIRELSVSEDALVDYGFLNETDNELDEAILLLELHVVFEVLRDLDVPFLNWDDVVFKEKLCKS